MLFSGRQHIAYSPFKKCEDTLFFGEFLCFWTISDAFTHCRPVGFRYVFVLQIEHFRMQELQQSKLSTHHTCPPKHTTTQKQPKNNGVPKSVGTFFSSILPPLAAITAQQTLGIRHVSRSINDDPNPAHSCFRIVIRPSADVGKFGQFRRPLFNLAQHNSIGFKSGDCGGHVITSKTFSSLSASLTTMVVCFGSLSCWKTKP